MQNITKAYLVLLFLSKLLKNTHMMFLVWSTLISNYIFLKSWHVFTFLPLSEVYNSSPKNESWSERFKVD